MDFYPHCLSIFDWRSPISSMLGVRRRGKVCLAVNISWTGGLRWGASFEVRMWIGKRFWWDHVAKRIINHLPHPHNIDYRWYKPFPNGRLMIVLPWGCNKTPSWCLWHGNVAFAYMHMVQHGVWQQKSGEMYLLQKTYQHIHALNGVNILEIWHTLMESQLVCDLKPTHEWDKSGGEVTWKKWCHQLKRGMIMAPAWVHGNPPQHGFVSGVWYQYVRISVSIWRLVHLFESD